MLGAKKKDSSILGGPTHKFAMLELRKDFSDILNINSQPFVRALSSDFLKHAQLACFLHANYDHTLSCHYDATHLS